MVFQNVGSYSGGAGRVDRVPAPLHQPQPLLRHARAAQEEGAAQPALRALAPARSLSSVVTHKHYTTNRLHK